jgi:hypothetical protein
MKILTDTDSVLVKHAEMIAFTRAKLIDGYCQLHIKKCPRWMPKTLYMAILRKVLVLNFFKNV